MVPSVTMNGTTPQAGDQTPLTAPAALRTARRSPRPASDRGRRASPGRAQRRPRTSAKIAPTERSIPPAMMIDRHPQRGRADDHRLLGDRASVVDADRNAESGLASTIERKMATTIKQHDERLDEAPPSRRSRSCGRSGRRRHVGLALGDRSSMRSPTSECLALAPVRTAFDGRFPWRIASLASSVQSFVGRTSRRIGRGTSRRSDRRRSSIRASTS